LFSLLYQLHQLLVRLKDRGVPMRTLHHIGQDAGAHAEVVEAAPIALLVLLVRVREAQD
jgi:hypothetical protein